MRRLLSRTFAGAACGVAAAGVLGACVQATPGPRPHADPPTAARKLFDVTFVREITAADNFVLRPDEYGGPTFDAGDSGDAIYAGGRGGAFFKLRAGDGAVLWRRDVGDSVFGVATIDAETNSVIVGTDDGELHALHRDSGEVLWSYETAGRVRNAALVRDGVVYFATSRDQVFALDVRDGAWRWQYEREFVGDVFTVHGRAGLLWIDGDDDADDRLITGFDDGHVVSLHAGSGEVLASFDTATTDAKAFLDADATPVYRADVGDLVVAGQSSGVYGLDPVSLKPKWERAVRGVSHLGQGMAGSVIAVSSLAGLVALDGAGRTLWQRQLEPGTLGEPVTVGGTLFVPHSEQGLAAFSSVDGRHLATFDVGSGMSGRPGVDEKGRRLLAMSNRGTLYSLRLTLP